MSDSTVQANRAVWELASAKHVREYDDLLAQARSGPALTAVELELLGPLLRQRPAVVHLQSGQGLDDIALTHAGASGVIGVDYSVVAATSAARRASELGLPCAYVVAQLPPAPLRDGCADLVYTGKGALIWIPDLQSWADDVFRLLEPGGRLFVHEAHPMVPLYRWDADAARLRPDRSYFDRQHVNDTFPARGAVEWQWTLGDLVTAVVRAGLRIEELREHPEPFWRPGDVEAAVWDGRLPNTFSLLARRPLALADQP
ncbi:class I SAM-dependent methyltransferase [uncultured Friedmanniella sp.]|uniref:class I SAM-dependent methyltransferase n=1 Tax=uncultured Friedmanniella sp. TaxID=335381 RepID=UPI0035CA3C9B